ncbi:MAG: ADP-ribosylation factor-like protein [Candidatus Hodarchaeota archaeon]
MTETKKIVLCGLAQSGKTTIRKWLFKELTDITETNLPATVDYEIHTQIINNTEIVFWDLGGVTAFLDRFVGRDPNNNISNTIFKDMDTLVYVINSIEIKDISQSREYLNLCLKKTTKYSPMAAIFILQHKIDLIPTKMRKEVYHTIKDYLFKDIKQHLWYYETSMVNTSIVVAMCAVYHATLGYIPNNVIPEPLTS